MLRAALALTASVGGYAGWLVATNNFHTVIPGRLYRSAQPDGAEIADYAARYGIRTIVNLRGRYPDASWYREETEASARLGIDHVDFKMSSSRLLDPSRSKALIAMLASARTPILIHCMAGADRTGLVASYYVADVAKLGEEAAESELSILYGHVGLPLAASFPMNISFETMEPQFGFYGS